MVRSTLTTVEISRKNLIHNLCQFRHHLGDKTKIMAVVKSNAYGHGGREVSQIISKNGADWLGVNSFEEGIILRDLGIRLPILVLGYITPENLTEAIKKDLSLVVFNLQAAEDAEKYAKKTSKKAKIHIKIETGTNRLGIRLENLSEFAKFLRKKKNIFVEGVYTHYANIEDERNSEFAFCQLNKFEKAITLLRKEKIFPLLRHTACTAAAILYKKTLFDLARIGIGLYGLWPSKETKTSAPKKRITLDLRPVLSWKTRIIQIKEVAKGETIGYGRTFKTSRKSRIAVLPVGYWDGYDRRLSNCGRVLIRGFFAPVVGRICMNMFMVDVTDIEGIKPSDEVVLLGKQGKNEITAEEIAQKIGTINYEVVTRINPELLRKVV